MDIVIETEPDSGVLEKLPDAVAFTPKHFAGGPELVHALVSLTALTLPLVAKVIVEELRRRRHIRIVVKDGRSGGNLDIRGVSDRQAAEMVEHYLREMLRAESKEK